MQQCAWTEHQAAQVRQLCAKMCMPTHSALGLFSSGSKHNIKAASRQVQTTTGSILQFSKLQQDKTGANKEHKLSDSVPKMSCPIVQAQRSVESPADTLQSNMTPSYTNRFMVQQITWCSSVMSKLAKAQIMHWIRWRHAALILAMCTASTCYLLPRVKNQRALYVKTLIVHPNEAQLINVTWWVIWNTAPNLWSGNVMQCTDHRKIWVWLPEQQFGSLQPDVAFAGVELRRQQLWSNSAVLSELLDVHPW